MARASSFLLLVVWLAGLPSPLEAGEPPAAVLTSAGPRLDLSALATVRFGDDARLQAPTPQARDSLLNGAVIGAVVGAAALGGFGLFLCHALDDTGDPNCFPGVLAIAALGAGIGAGAGVAIDVLITRQATPGVRATLTF